MEKKYHDLKLGVVSDGTDQRGARYMGVRYCPNCKIAEPALGFFYRVPDHAPVLQRSKLDLRMRGMPELCPKAATMVMN